MPSPAEPLAPERLESDRRLDETLRPRTLDEFVGQEGVRANLRVFIRAARERGEPLDHALFYGPPGLGKTALAHVVAHEMAVSMRSTSSIEAWGTTSIPLDDGIGIRPKRRSSSRRAAGPTDGWPLEAARPRK